MILERGRAMSERTVFIAALQIAEPAERHAYLDEACSTNAALRRRVEILLRVLDNASGFLESQAFADNAGPEKQRPSLMAIFDKALDISSPTERKAYLSAACAGESALR